MTLPLVFRPRVAQDLAAAYGWYEDQRAGLGEELLRAVNASFDAIQEFSQTYSPVHGQVRRAMVSRFPYGIFYRVEKKRLVVLTILHAARDPRLWPRPRKK